MPRCRYCGSNEARFRLVRRLTDTPYGPQYVRYSQCSDCNSTWRTNTSSTYGRRSNR